MKQYDINIFDVSILREDVVRCRRHTHTTPSTVKRGSTVKGQIVCRRPDSAILVWHEYCVILGVSSETRLHQDFRTWSVSRNTTTTNTTTTWPKIIEWFD